MYGGFFQNLTKQAKSSVCYSKNVLFFIEKEYVIENFVLKERKVVSIAAKRDNK